MYIVGEMSQQMSNSRQEETCHLLSLAFPEFENLYQSSRSKWRNVSRGILLYHLLDFHKRCSCCEQDRGCANMFTQRWWPSYQNVVKPQKLQGLSASSTSKPQYQHDGVNQIDSVDSNSIGQPAGSSTTDQIQHITSVTVRNKDGSTTATASEICGLTLEEPMQEMGSLKQIQPIVAADQSHTTHPSNSSTGENTIDNRLDDEEGKEGHIKECNTDNSQLQINKEVQGVVTNIPDSGNQSLEGLNGILDTNSNSPVIKSEYIEQFQGKSHPELAVTSVMNSSSQLDISQEFDIHIREEWQWHNAEAFMETKFCTVCQVYHQEGTEHGCPEVRLPEVQSHVEECVDRQEVRSSNCSGTKYCEVCKLVYQNDIGHCCPAGRLKEFQIDIEQRALREEALSLVNKLNDDSSSDQEGHGSYEEDSDGEYEKMKVDTEMLWYQIQVFKRVRRPSQRWGYGKSGPKECLQCLQDFPNQEDLRQHLTVHEIFIPSLKLRLGRNNVWLQVKFCNLCKIYFKYTNKHIPKCVDPRPYKCIICKKGFPSKKGLQRHNEGSHDARKYLCDLCGKLFPKANALRDHRLSHANLRTKVCKICGAAFNTTTRLLRHMVIHNTEQHRACEYCDRTFTQYGNLKRHMRMHTGEKPYKCDQCSATFTHNVSLKTHKKSKHGVDWWATQRTLGNKINISC